MISKSVGTCSRALWGESQRYALLILGVCVCVLGGIFYTFYQSDASSVLLLFIPSYRAMHMRVLWLHILLCVRRGSEGGGWGGVGAFVIHMKLFHIYIQKHLHISPQFDQLSPPSRYFSRLSVVGVVTSGAGRRSSDIKRSRLWFREKGGK